MTTYAQKATKIAEMFTRGHNREEVLVAGLSHGWDRADVERVIADKGWALTRAGRLPVSALDRPKKPPMLRPTVIGREPQEKRRRHLTVNEIADDLGVSKMSVYRLLEEGVIGSFRIGRSYRVPLDAYQRFLNDAYTDASDGVA